MSHLPPAIPPRFTDALLLHLARCFSMNGVAGSAQILLIVGEPGTGKTFQLTHTLSMHGVACVNFGAIEIENPSANEPLRVLRSRVDTVRRNLESGTPSALVIDDADLLLGRFALTQYTHNLQRVTAELMKIASAINAEDGIRPLAAPIFMLANNIDILHGPLLRPGRARLFQWKPTGDELQFVLERIFLELSSDDVRALRKEFPRQRVAFFSALRDALVDNYLLGIVRTGSPFESLQLLLEQRGHARPILRYSLAHAIDIGKTMQTTSLVDIVRGGNGGNGRPRPPLHPSLRPYRLDRSWPVER